MSMGWVFLCRYTLPKTGSPEKGASENKPIPVSINESEEYPNFNKKGRETQSQNVVRIFGD